MMTAVLSGRIRGSAGYSFGKSVLKTQQLKKINIILIHSHATVSQNSVFIACRKRFTI
jgi:hypothetical protein